MEAMPLNKRINLQRCNRGYQRWIGDAAQFLYDHGYINKVKDLLNGVKVPTNAARKDKNAFTTWAKSWFLGLGMRNRDIRKFVCTSYD
jgi:hypothetical protein